MFAKHASFFKPSGVKAKHNSNLTTLEKKRSKIFTITINGAGENPHFLTPDLLKSLSSKLDEVKSEFTQGSVLITTAEGENFCKGFPRDGYHEVIYLFRELVKELISLPMPTIAAINGPAENAGLILAMSHDHLTMETGAEVLSMIELDNKEPLPDYFTAMIRSKVMPGALARLALSSSKFNYEEAKEMGLPILRPDAEEKPWYTASSFAEVLSNKNWDGKVYAEIRKSLYPELCNVLGLGCASSSRL